MSYFDFKVVDINNQNSTESLEEIFKLRYQVYCIEWGFEKPEDHPSGLEYDEYDPFSVHFVISSRKTKDLVGTSRIILNSELGFPIEKFFNIDKELPPFERNKIAEISRLAISKPYRHRAVDDIIFEQQAISRLKEIKKDQIQKERRESDNAIVQGIYKAIYLESKNRGLTHWYAVMEKGLFLILKRWGIPFSVIGPNMKYHGLRAPYIACIADIEKAVARKNPQLFMDATGASKS